MNPFKVKVLEEVHSSVNGDIRVVKSLGLGTYIQVEGLTQSGGLIVNVWKHALKNLRTKEVKDCLILGLGGGSAAKLVKKYWPKAKITGVDIDPVMVDLGEKYLRLKGVEVKIADAYDFAGDMVKRGHKFDLILIDTYLGHEYPKKFESAAFVEALKKIVSPGGVVVFNRLYYAEKRPSATKFGAKLEKFFAGVEYIYPEANVIFVCYN